MIATIDAGAQVISEHLNLPDASWTTEILDNRVVERLIVKYSFKTSEKSMVQVVGKFYSDTSGEKTFRWMKALESTLERLSPECNLAIPHALLYDPGNQLLVQELVTGVSYVGLMEGEDRTDHAHKAGRALACLHGIELSEGKNKGLKEHIAELIRPNPIELAERYPEYRSLIECVLKTFATCQNEWEGTFSPRPIHRDFHLRQLFLDVDRVWLIDWDLFALGDPAFDVAYFIVYLRTHLSPAIYQQCSDAFLSGYFPQGPDDLLYRVPIYEAFNYLRRACRRYRIKDAGWEKQMRAMLSELERRHGSL